MSLPINEIFETIQGEGSNTGTPAIFIRLQGCLVGCPWCDTRYTWAIDAPEIDAGNMALKGRGEESWASVEVEQLVALTANYRSELVVITGGEPCMHDLTPLTAALADAGKRVQIETSGTYPVRCDERTWVTVSPKIGMPGGRTVLPEALARANEIKMPVGKPEDVVALFGLLEAIGQHPPAVFLQPLSLSRRATDLCVAAAIANGFRVSLQVHALAGWR